MDEEMELLLTVVTTKEELMVRAKAVPEHVLQIELY